MKINVTRLKKILLLIVVFSSTNIFSQNVKIELLDLQKLLNYNIEQIKKNGEYLLDTRTRQIWNQNLQSWDNDSLFEYTYNSQALVDTITAHRWLYGSYWAKYSRWIYIYNSSNQVIELGLYFWHTTNWDIYARTIYTYTGNNLWKINSQFWSGGGWNDHARSTYNWNTNNQIVRKVFEIFDGWIGIWCNFWKKEYFYDSTYRVERTIEFDGDCSPIWKYDNQNLFTYDEQGNLIEDIGQNWVDSIWVNDFQYKYEYDSSNILIRTVFMNWKSDSLNWESLWRESYTYNTCGNQTTTLTEIWVNQTKWQNSTYRIIEYDINENWIQDVIQNWDSIHWVNQFRYLATWSEPVSVNDDKIQTDNYQLSQNYPNPFNPTTKIKFTIPTSPLNPSPYLGEGNRERLITLKVYDVLGNEIATLVNEEKPAGTYEVEFDGTGLPSGIYFYKLNAGTFVETKKMVLLK